MTIPRHGGRIGHNRPGRGPYPCDFPILSRTVRDGKPLVYLDSGCHLAAARPGARRRAHLPDHVQRGGAPWCPSTPAEEATDAYEGCRARRSPGLSAPVPTRSCSPRTPPDRSAWSPIPWALGDDRSVGVRRQSHWARATVVITGTRTPRESGSVAGTLPSCHGATLRWFGVTDEGRIDSIHSNSTTRSRSSRSPISRMSPALSPTCRRTCPHCARAVGALVVLDACQSVPHMAVDFTALDGISRRSPGTRCSGAVRCGRAVRQGRSAGSAAAVHHRWIDDRDRVDGYIDVRAAAAAVRGGVPMTSQVVGLGAAVGYLHAIGMDTLAAHEHSLTERALELLAGINGVRIVGPSTATAAAARCRSSSTASTPTTWARSSTTRASRSGWGILRLAAAQAVRCRGTARASFAVYNTLAEVDALAAAIVKAQDFFGAR